MKIANKRCPKGNILLYISFAAISFAIMLMISTIQTENLIDTLAFDSGALAGAQDVERESFVERFLSADNIMNAMYIMLIISFALTTIVVTSIWGRSRHQLMYAWHLCGMEMRFQFLEILKRYFCVAVTGFVSAALILIIITAVNSDISVKLQDVAMAFVMTMGFGGVMITTDYIINIIFKRES